MSDIQTDELVHGVDDAIDRLLADRDALLKSCKELYGIIERGELVRDISGDARSDYALRMMKFVMVLQACEMAIGGR